MTANAIEGYRFVNWAETYTCSPQAYFEPENEEELREILNTARQRTKRVKVVGCGQSPSDIACTDDFMISLRHFHKVIAVDVDNLTIRVEAGVNLEVLNELLPQYGLTLPVQGAVSDVTIGGVIATGTHGSSTQGGIFSSHVTELTLMTGRGEVLHCSREENTDVFLSALCGLGAIGIMMDVTIKCDRACNLMEMHSSKTLEKALNQLDEDSKDAKYYEFFYYPHTGMVDIVKIKETMEAVKPTFSWFWDRFIGCRFFEFLLYLATYFTFLIPLLNKAYYKTLRSKPRQRVDRSDRVLSFECLFRQRVQEWSIPRSQAGEALKQMNDWIKRTGYKAHLPWEVRFVRGDDIYLSPAYGEDKCYINIIAYRPYGKDYPYEEFFQAFEDVMLELGGRPHWAMSFSADGTKLKSRYPKWSEFDGVRQRADPDNLFMNAYLERFFGKS